MKREILKGALLLFATAVGVFALFLLVSGTTGDKAICVARALASHVAFGNIEKVCELGARRR